MSRLTRRAASIVEARAMKAAAETLRATEIKVSLADGDKGWWRRSGTRFGSLVSGGPEVIEFLPRERVRARVNGVEAILVREGDAGLWVEVVF